jgi:hypothetical protein
MAPNTALSVDLYFLILVSVTIIMVIVMLNMLIALISESHGDVMKLEHQAAVYEKLQLIIDISNSTLVSFENWLRKPGRIIDTDQEYISILKNQKTLQVSEVQIGEEMKEIRYELEDLKRIVKEIKAKCSE